MYLPRLLESKLLSLRDAFPCVVVTGARQVGKSTLLQHLFGKDVETVVFEPTRDVGDARRDPDLFLRNHPPPLILDEIQYAPELVSALKKAIDRDRRPGQYFLAGSQRWEVIRSMAESLAGRAVFLDLEGFSLTETAGRSGDGWLAEWLMDPEGMMAVPPARMALPWSPLETVWRGQLPEARSLSLEVLPDYHAGYVRTYLERDARALIEVRDWHLFDRFLRYTAALTAQEINRAHWGRELSLRAETSQKWLSVLAGTCQWYEVAPYHGNALKRISGRSKGYFADTGLACHLQAISSPKALEGHPLWGRTFETAVVGEVRKQAGALSPAPILHHWRTYAGVEVDLIIEWNGCLYPIEIKAASQVGVGDIKGITSFRSTHQNRKVAPGLVVSLSEKAYRVGESVLNLPWDAFVTERAKGAVNS
jgi:hypothetical protein